MRKDVAAIVVVLVSAAIFKTFWSPARMPEMQRQISSSGLHIATGGAKSISEELIPAP